MKIIVGNWKMNGSAAELETMISALELVETKNKVAICVPFTMLGAKSEKLAFGAQDVSTHEKGAYTGEISAGMLADAGAKYVIVGHSERRQHHNETNGIVRQKASQALARGLIPIICVGETMEEKESGKTMDIIAAAVSESVPADVNTDIIIAYEPRWAIGAGLTPTESEIAAAHALIAKTLESMGLSGTAILYGASVNGGNANEIMSIKNVDGVLVGGASLKPDGFIPIITAI
ncbi:MAG: triose-phosphate isomerase [Rickettsiales bacterium]|nr:triose-phosphate isomerase [Rickettsiales bacterium]